LSQPYIVLSKSTKKPTIALYKRFDNNSNDYSNNYNFDDYSPDNNNYGKHIITFSIPVFDNDSNVIGITGLDIDLNNIISMLDKSKMTIAKEFVILTSDGIYLSHFNNELIGKSIKSNELFSNYNTDSVLNEISQNNNVLIENILGADNSALTVLYHHINIRNIDDTRLYAGIVLKNETIEINTSTFLENSLQYCVIFLILISVSSIFLAIIVENIFSNKITIEIDKKVLKK
jgi:methyl-accepting chemotaxis protein